MFTFSDLDIPLVGAPMAGGVSTPELVAAVSATGGLGMLGAGYYTVEKLAEHVREVRTLLGKNPAPFGVNLFSPQQIQGEDAARQLNSYRQVLAPLGRQYGIDTLHQEITIANHFSALVDWLVEHPVPVVTFTFGLPPQQTIQRLQAVGSAVGVSVTNALAAQTAEQAGANFLCVQGPLAGGHQSTFSIEEEPNELPLDRLIASMRQATALPFCAGGGVSKASDFSKILELGAQAVQVGTLLLLAHEAGTPAVYRRGLQESSYTQTTLTRSFTGRPARAVRNEFVERFDSYAPAVYPEIHYLTAPLRAAAKTAQNHQHINLWAGSGYHAATSNNAAQIIKDLSRTVPEDLN